MNLAELSTIVVWGATTAYALAFGAFAFDLARRADVATARRAARVEPVLAGAGARGGTVANPTLTPGRSTRRPRATRRSAAVCPTTCPTTDRAARWASRCR